MLYIIFYHICFVVFSDVDTVCYCRGAEIAKFDICPGTSKWP